MQERFYLYFLVLSGTLGWPGEAPESGIAYGLKIQHLVMSLKGIVEKITRQIKLLTILNCETHCLCKEGWYSLLNLPQINFSHHSSECGKADTVSIASHNIYHSIT